MTANIQKWGNSQGIRIPKILLQILKWSENEEVTVNTENDRIIIEKAKDKTTLSKLFADYNEDYKPEEINWGEPVGRELW